MNTIHQISLKLRLGIDTRANIPPEVLLRQWQDFNEKRFYAGKQALSSEISPAKTFKVSGSRAA